MTSIATEIPQYFKVGKYNIGRVNYTFRENFSSVDFEKRPMPTFQKLPRDMTDLEIERDLEPGMCTLGDLLAFLETPPEECKDGLWNLFYFPDFVVRVLWCNDKWYIGAWYRTNISWDAGRLVFSPTLNSKKLEI